MRDFWGDFFGLGWVGLGCWVSAMPEAGYYNSKKTDDICEDVCGEVIKLDLNYKTFLFNPNPSLLFCSYFSCFYCYFSPLFPNGLCRSVHLGIHCACWNGKVWVFKHFMCVQIGFTV